MTPDGLIHDAHIRTFYKPVDHTLRDWQHTMVGGGVANVECARALAACKKLGITIDVVSPFLLKFVFPKVHGKVDPNWMSVKRLGKKVGIAAVFFIIDALNHSHLRTLPLRDCWW